MPLPAFEPFEMPSPGGFSWADKITVKEAKFENNYGQRTRIGLNATGSDYDLRWEQCPAFRAEELRAFFKSRAGLPFLWEPPFESGILQFTCDDWSFDINAPRHGTFSAKFVRNFGVY